MNGKELFGREYKPVETYKTKGAETLILTMGSMGETASVAVDELRKAAKTIGLVKLRLWRPFPLEELPGAIKGCKTPDRHGQGGLLRRRRRSHGHGNQDRCCSTTRTGPG